MTDLLPSMTAALNQLADTRAKVGDLITGTATSGHPCASCGTDTVEVAPVYRLTAEGPVLFVWLRHCTTCCQPTDTTEN